MVIDPNLKRNHSVNGGYSGEAAFSVGNMQLMETSPYHSLLFSTLPGTFKTPKPSIPLPSSPAAKATKPISQTLPRLFQTNDHQPPK